MVKYEQSYTVQNNLLFTSRIYSKCVNKPIKHIPNVEANKKCKLHLGRIKHITFKKYLLINQVIQPTPVITMFNYLQQFSFHPYLI